MISLRHSPLPFIFSIRFVYGVLLNGDQLQLHRISSLHRGLLSAFYFLHAEAFLPHEFDLPLNRKSFAERTDLTMAVVRWVEYSRPEMEIFCSFSTSSKKKDFGKIDRLVTLAHIWVDVGLKARPRFRQNLVSISIMCSCFPKIKM